MNQEQRVRRMVRRVVYRTLGRALPASRGRRLVSEAEMMELAPGSEFSVPEGALLTPLARQIAMDRRIQLAEVGRPAAGVWSERSRVNPSTAPPVGPENPSGPPASAHPAGAADPSRLPAGVGLAVQASGSSTVAIGADHGGFALKQTLKVYLGELGYPVMDCGTSSPDSVDYPDFALAVAQQVAQGQAWRGIVLDGAGIGSCMAANKVPGVRAAMCYDLATALNSREHNDANVLTLGAGLIGPNLARQIVKTWLEARFGGERHARRVDKITQIERRYSR